MPGSALAVLSLLVLSAPLSAAEPCGWLPTRGVDAALPELAPWGVMDGGAAGSCGFVSTSGPPHTFDALQMVKTSAQEAASVVRESAESAAGFYGVVAAKGLGAEAYTYRPKGELSDHTIFFMAHEGRVVVFATLSLEVPVGPGHIEGATRLVRAAAAIDRDPVALAALTSCPWFTTDLVRKLLPGEGFRQQSLGSNACIAMAGDSVVHSFFFEMQGLTAELFAYTRGRDCSHEPVAALGPLSEVRWACQGVPAHAGVRYFSGNRLFHYTFSPGREPTAAERGLLIELAKSAPARAN
jgi:hypothetical protein